MHPPQPLPTGETVGDAFARELALSLGPSFQPADGTMIAADLRTWGGAIAIAYTTQTTALDQAFAQTVTDCLVEWETRLGLPINARLTTAQRQNAILSKRRASGGNSTFHLTNALNAIPVAFTIHTLNSSDVTGDPRQVFTIAVEISDTDWADTRIRTLIEGTLAQMMPAFVLWDVVVTVGFLTDDSDSLTDRDVLGA